MRFRQLTSLSLCGCTDVDETMLRFIARLPSLRRLDLSNCASVDDRLLLSLVSLGKLESLNLAGYGVIDLLTLAIAGLGLSCLLWVKVWCLLLSRYGAVLHLCPRMAFLKERIMVFLLQVENHVVNIFLLRSNRCNVSDGGLWVLAERGCDVHAVDVSGCHRVTDYSLEFLSIMPNLWSLSMRDNPDVTDDVCDHYPFYTHVLCLSGPFAINPDEGFTDVYP